MLSFTAFGHVNIKGTHKNTIEFTKDKELTLKGDCILGINACFDLKKIKEFIKGREKMVCRISAGNLSDEFGFIPNQKFNDNHEMVFRLGEFASERTLGIRATKAAKHINRDLVENLKKGKKASIYFY
ncbi:DUF371 domain-containing protein [Candidatus Woesearchaeota archaeon]|nr:DUF371 domain-containing protein [Candidatus Woesearchaeota archaeon]